MKNLFYILLAFLIFSCSNDNESVGDIPFHINSGIADRADTVTVYFGAKVTGDENPATAELFGAINKAELHLNSGGKTIFTEEINEISKTTFPVDNKNRQYQMVMNRKIPREKISGVSSPEFAIVFRTGQGDISYPITKNAGNQTLSSNNNSPFLYFPFIEKDGNDYIFGVDVLKISDSDQEIFFPNSQSIKVILKSEKGKTIWDSSEDQYYMQMLVPFEPENRGEIFRYSLRWDGRYKNGDPVDIKELSAEIILPVRDYPYRITTEFNMDNVR